MEQLERLIEELASTTSLNDKVEILKKHDTPLNREAMNIALNPYILTNIKKFDKYEVGNQDTEAVWSDFKNLVNRLNTHAVSGGQAKAEVKAIMDKCTLRAQTALKLLLLKDLKVGVGVALVEKAYGSYIDKFSVQLAEKYSDFIKKGGDSSITHFWATPKLDGIRGFYNGSMLSRNGKQIVGFDHIYDELNTLMSECDVTFVDGELYSHEIPFQTISSIVAKKAIDDVRKKKLKYCVFYIGGDWKNTDEMVKRFSECQTKYTFKHLTFVPYRMVMNTEKDINALCEQYVEQGYEGVMLRHPVNHYSWRRDTNLMKHKLFIEDDFKITGFDEGEKGGACEGTLGAIIIEGTYEDKKIIAYAGSGFKLSGEGSRDWFWNNRQTLLGQIAEIKFQGVTDKPIPRETWATRYPNHPFVENTYSLRFPIYRKLKEDR